MNHLLLVALFFAHTPIPAADQEQTLVCFQLQDGKVMCPTSTDDGSKPVIEKKEYKQCEGEGETRICGA